MPLRSPLQTPQSYYLMQLLGYHIALGNVTVSELYPNQVFLSASGDPFYVEFVERTWPCALLCMCMCMCVVHVYVCCAC